MEPENHQRNIDTKLYPKVLLFSILFCLYISYKLLIVNTVNDRYIFKNSILLNSENTRIHSIVPFHSFKKNTDDELQTSDTSGFAVESRECRIPGACVDAPVDRQALRQCTRQPWLADRSRGDCRSRICPPQVPNSIRDVVVVPGQLGASSQRCPVEIRRYRSILVFQRKSGKPGDDPGAISRLPAQPQSVGAGFEGPDSALIDLGGPASPEPGGNAVDERQVFDRPPLPRTTDRTRHRFRQRKPRVEEPERASLGRSPDAAADTLGQLPAGRSVSIARDQSLKTTVGTVSPVPSIPPR